MIQDELFKPETGLVICVSGPSGVGKSTVVAEALRRNSAIWLSSTATTRAPRPGEQEGR